ncbi:putative metallocarboxypeptidase ecm14 [Tulasnella sp. 418]|nr:putative metallocarboxypeptidase ecm14 [Tulasnella sp. 418]
MLVWKTLIPALLATASNGLFVPSEQKILGSQGGGYHVRRYSFQSDDVKDELISQAKRHGLDIWGVGESFVDIHLGAGSADLPKLLQELPHNSFSVAADSSMRPRPTPMAWNLTSLTSKYHDAYHPIDEVVAFLEQLSEDFDESMELIELGRTHEGREILAVSITKKSKRRRKPRIVIQGAQHAREWIASSTALYLAHAFAVDSSEKYSMKSLLNYVDVTIIPVPNPDGYQYTWSHDRLWYKNRSPVGSPHCRGIDINRNWAYEWSPGVEDDPCSFWYPGAHAFEAAEVKAIAAYIDRTPNIKAFIDLRSYGQLIMHPFSFTCDEYPADEENLLEAGLGAAKAYGKAHGTHMTAGSLCHKLYSAPGNVVDWMYAEADIPLSYSVMLRDTGTYGFLLPPKMIRPVGEETSDLVEYLIQWIRKHRKL